MGMLADKPMHERMFAHGCGCQLAKDEKPNVGSVSTRVNHAKAWDTKPQALPGFPRVAGLPKDR